MQGIVYNIIKNEEIVGNLYEPYGNFLLAISRIIKILDNYNRNLSKSKLPDSLLVVRMLECENEDATYSNNKKPRLCDNCKEVIKACHPDFNVIDSNMEDLEKGFISVLHGGINSNIKMAYIQVFIDMDNSLISFSHAYEKCDLKVWESANKRSAANLNNCPYNFNSIHINELSDVYYFVRENMEGWRYSFSPNEVFFIASEVA